MNFTLDMEQTEVNVREEVLRFVSQFDSLTSEEAEEIGAHLKAKAFKKGQILVKEGEITRECYFVIKGCLRQYVILDGDEKTTEFYTENQAAVLFSSYTSQSKSTSYLVSNENSIVIVGTPTEEDKMYQKFPKLAHITRMMLEQDFGQIQNKLTHFITSSPEERYQHLLSHRPDLLQRVPQHQLASYLGITPESLSRIRKRILKSS